MSKHDVVWLLSNIRVNQLVFTLQLIIVIEVMIFQCPRTLRLNNFWVKAITIFKLLLSSGICVVKISTNRPSQSIQIMLQWSVIDFPVFFSGQKTPPILFMQ